MLTPIERLRTTIYGVIAAALLWSCNFFFFNAPRTHLYFSIVILAFVMLMYGFEKPDINDFFIAYGIFYFWLAWLGHHRDAAMVGICVWIEYYIAKIIGRKIIKKPVWLLTFISIITLVFFIRGIISYRFLLYHPYQYTWPFWGLSGHDMPRTQHEFFLVIPAAMLVFWILALKKHISYAAGIIVSLITLAMSLYATGRMSFCIMAIVFAIIIIMYLIENRPSITFKPNKTHLICLIILLMVVTLLLYKSNLLDVFSTVRAERSGILGNARFTLWKNAFMMMLDYPLMGYPIKTIYSMADHAHNCWIDMGKFGGIVPFILTTGFTVITIVRLFRLSKKEHCMEKYSLFAAFFAMTLYNLVEPVIIGNLLFWNVEVFLSGLVCGCWFGAKEK